MSKTIHFAPLGDAMKIAIDAVPVDPSASYKISGVYSFGRGLFGREPLAGSQTTYKVFHRLHENDFVLSQVKGWEGALARVTKQFDGWFLSPQFPTFRADTEKLDIRYVEWYCKQNLVWEQLRKKSRGMGARRETVSPTDFLSLQIPLPPLDEQRRIVARIEALAGRIAEARGLRQEAVSEAEELFDSQKRKMFAVACDKSLYISRMADLCTRITDGTHVTPTYVEQGIPFLSVKDITSGKIDFSNCRFIDSAEHATLKARCNPEYGDVLLTKVGTTGFAKAIDVHKEFSIFVSLALLKIDRNRLDSRFVEYMLNSPALRSKSAEGTRGVGNKNLVLKFIREFEFPVPSIHEQKQIVSYLDDISDRVEALKRLQAETQAELDALLPSVLDKAFKGEL